MTALDRTAYPRFTRPPTALELYELYTPTEEELTFVTRVTRSTEHRLHMMVLLKVFQRLGYVPDLADIPPDIILHLQPIVGMNPDGIIPTLDERTRRKHASAVRHHLGVWRANQAVRARMERAIRAAAAHMDNPADLINAAIEELIRQRCELPAYSTLDDAAQQIRTAVNADLFQVVHDQLTADQHAALNALLLVDSTTGRSGFARLKEPPPRASFTHLAAWLDRVHWLDSLGSTLRLLAHILPAKILHLAAQAKALDLDDLHPDQMAAAKRVTLLLCLHHHTQRRTRDQLVEMFLKRVARMHRSGREKLVKLRDDHRTTTAALIDVLGEVVQTTETFADDQQLGPAIRSVFVGHGGVTSVRKSCEEIAAYHSNNHYPLMTTYFGRYRALFFRLIRSLHLYPTTNDSSVMTAVQTLMELDPQRATLVPSELDLDFANDMWHRTIIVRKRNTILYRRQHLEACIFSVLAEELKAGDIAVVGAEQFADYRDQLLPWAACAPQIASYCATTGKGRSRRVYGSAICGVHDTSAWPKHA